VSFQNRIGGRPPVRCNPERFALLEAEQILCFDRRDKQIDTWLHVRQGDVLVAVNDARPQVLRCTVEARGFLTSCDTALARHPNFVALAVRVSINGFKKIGNSKLFVDHLIKGQYEISVCQHRDEDRRLERSLASHKFGRGSSIVKVVVTKAGDAVGGALLDHYAPSWPNATPLHAVPHYDMLRDHMFIVRRIVNARPDISSSIHIQELCIDLCERISALLTDEDTVVIVGNSYDFLFSAVRRGFKCEVPEIRGHPIFYWKPLRGLKEDLEEPRSLRYLYQAIDKYRRYKARNSI
jgi:hypothetical protein